MGFGVVGPSRGGGKGTGRQGEFKVSGSALFNESARIASLNYRHRHRKIEETDIRNYCIGFTTKQIVRMSFSALGLAS